jgi:hypothetical protein
VCAKEISKTNGRRGYVSKRWEEARAAERRERRVEQRKSAREGEAEKKKKVHPSDLRATTHTHTHTHTNTHKHTHTHTLTYMRTNRTQTHIRGEGEVYPPASSVPPQYSRRGA